MNVAQMEWGRALAALAALSTTAAVVWSSSLPLWIGLRVYSEQVLLLVLSVSMAITFLTRARRSAREGGPDILDVALAACALVWGLVLIVRFPTLSQNVFYHPTEALIVSAIGIVLLLSNKRV